MTQPLRRVAVRVPLAEREDAIGLLLDLAPDGFEEDEEDEYEGAAVFAVYTDATGETRLQQAFADAVGTTVEPGWEDRWREFHQPVLAGGLWIGPPWHCPPAGVPAVVVDPGRAFGTGAHPTTRLCVELLARLDTRGSVVDVGCGSGVLAIAAVRLGFAPVVAIDVDPVAIEATLANAAANGAAVDARLVDALSEPIPTADVAVANVLLAPVETILARLSAIAAVTSGYLEGERPGHPGWMHATTAALDGWAADVFARSA
jgi:ribosomal protein L11 methyltransferase